LYFPISPDILREAEGMPDSKRLPLPPDDAAARDSQIDALLEEGLDRYFNNRYEDAIHIWTRVLFLDRNHPRARAYVDRARTALAEVHRRSEEMLQASRELLEQGKTDDARQLLAEAIATTGDDLQSAALRAHLERRERASIVSASGSDVQQALETVPGWTWKPRTLGAPVIIGVAAGFVVAVLGVAAILNLGDSDPSPIVTSINAPLPTLSSSQVALVRARALFARGRHAEALQKLDGVAAGSPERPAADALRIEIQQQLLDVVRSSTGGSSLEAIRR
jgi:tetratricopeptide (TPR) repeat protein